MIIPLQITWRDIDPSPALEADIRKKAAKLEQFHDIIISCHAVVEASHRQHHQGNLYRLRLDITVPGKEIVVSRDPGDNHAHEDMYVAIRDAFNTARRQLQDYNRKRQGKVKVHPVQQPARINKLFPDRDYGFLLTPDDDEIFFHRNALVNVDFDALTPGTEVHFVEEMGDEGPQAAQVSVPKSQE